MTDREALQRSKVDPVSTLTKFELFVGLSMAGLLAKNRDEQNPNANVYSPEGRIQEAIKTAELIIKKLNQP
jgi:hypothetical protein